MDSTFLSLNKIQRMPPQPQTDKVEEAESQRSIVRSAGVIGGMTFLSRILGLAREVVYAAIFGAGAVNDAFRIAYGIPYFFRRVLGEGAMSAYFLPLFVDYRENQGEPAAWQLANNVFNTLGLLTLLLAGVFALFAPQILYVIAPGFVKAGNIGLAIDLTREMAPFMVLMSLSALQMSILNAYKRFALPASGTIILNISFIASLYFIVPLFGDLPPEMIHGAAVAVLIGGLLQFATLSLGTHKLGMHWRPRFNLKDPGLRTVMKLMLPALFGMAVTRINLLVDNSLASLLGEGTISSLNYAERLLQFPIGIFGVGLATAILPTLSRYAARGEGVKLRETMNYALRMAIFVAIPAGIGLIVLRKPLLALLFQRGAFTAAATNEAAWALLFYGMGVAAYIAVSVVVPVFYAQKDTRTPVIAGAIAVGVNIVGDLILMWDLRQGGLALASAVAAYVNLGILLWILRRRVGRIGLKKVAISALKTVAAGIAMAGALLALVSISGFTPENSNFGFALLIGGGGVVLGGLVYLLASKLLRSKELGEVSAIVKGRLGRGRG
jgi:putative peptidoglycan lipid II flippase